MFGSDFTQRMITQRYLRAARRNGLSTDEIKEVLLQTAIYCGVPDANTAFRIATRVLAQGEGPEGGSC